MERESALLTGESGILLVAFRLAPSADLANDLLRRVRENVANETNELMWGSPGTLMAARLMLDWTGDCRWREAWEESADALLARRESDGLWTQLLYGHTDRILGPVHGYVGNVLALGQGLEARARAALQRTSNRLLARFAVVEDGLANWPPTVSEPLVHRTGVVRCAVVPRRARDGRIRRRVPRRGAAPRRRGAHVAGRASRRRARLVDLPRHRG